jgi:PmbA protein
VGARALHLAGGRRGLGEILADVDAGLYVQEVTGWHSGANPVSGDVSLGALGCLVSGGALGTPVREVTISETLPRLLRSVREVGGDERWLPGGAAGVTLVIDDVMVSGR